MIRPLPFRRFVVRDTSMRPTLEPGDRLLVYQWFGQWRQGDLIVFFEPDARLTISVKRVASASTAGVLVAGDNPNVSRDSREYGPVPRKLVFGRAVYRYLPRERRGRLT